MGLLKSRGLVSWGEDGLVGLCLMYYHELVTVLMTFIIWFSLVITGLTSITHLEVFVSHLEASLLLNLLSEVRLFPGREDVRVWTPTLRTVSLVVPISIC